MENLNPKQEEACQSTEGILRIIAGAGSGKTKVLVNRYEHLLTSIGCNPRNILCVTFTAKAAESMQNRIKKMIGEGFDTTLITTYHGFCVRVLRDDIFLMKYPKGFMILDEAEQKKIIKELNEEKNIDYHEISVEQVLKNIHEYKKDESYVSKLIDNTNIEITHENRFIEGYLRKQKTLSALDFDDLINFTLKLFEDFPEILKKWQHQLEYIMVDEFQDSTNREMKIITMLAKINGNLMVVGDPDQNIYEWRGSKMELLVDFDLIFPNTKTIILEENYRSVPKILDCANHVISFNSKRIEKNLFTEKSSDFVPVFLNAKNQETELKFIMDIIKKKLSEGKEYKDIAILYRSSFLSRYIETEFISRKIPYEIVSDIAFFDRTEIKDIVAYLKLVEKTSDEDAAFKRIINVPPRKFGKAKLRYLMENSLGRTLFDTLLDNLDNMKIINEGIFDFINCILRLREWKEKIGFSDLFDSLLNLSGYEKYLSRTQSLQRLENLAELKRYMTEFETLEDNHLQAFLRTIEKKAEIFEDKNQIKLMTIHASKGLEFPICIIVGMQDGIFPNAKTLEERKLDGLEEERRIMYVAITRAKEELYLTNYQTENGNKISRFIKELGTTNYLYEGIKENLTRDFKRKNEKKTANLLPGDKLMHPLFKEGEVREIDYRFESYMVYFPINGKVRTLSFDFVNKLFEEPEKMNEEYKLAIEDIKQIKETETIVSEEIEEVSGEIIFPKEIEEINKKNKDAFIKEETSLNNFDQEIINYIIEDFDANKEVWQCINIIDLGKPIGLCEFCEKQYVRYLHIMKHPADAKILKVGCVCAGKLEGNTLNAKRRENIYKNVFNRLERFLKRTWKVSNSGNLYLKSGQEVMTIIKDKYNSEKFRFFLNDKLSEAFDSIEDAKKEIFFRLLKEK